MSEPNTITTTKPLEVFIAGDPLTLEPGTYPVVAQNTMKYLIRIPDGRSVVVMKDDTQ